MFLAIKIRWLNLSAFNFKQLIDDCAAGATTLNDLYIQYEGEYIFKINAARNVFVVVNAGIRAGSVFEHF